MSTPYLVIPDLDQALEHVADATVSRTLYQDERLKVVLFAFAAGQELSQHTASTPATLHFLAGEAEVGLGEDAIAASAGTWIHLPARLPHSIRAKTAVKMLLALVKNPA